MLTRIVVLSQIQWKNLLADEGLTQSTSVAFIHHNQHTQ